MNRAEHLDYFRGLAIVLIVAGHSLVGGKDYYLLLTSFLFDGGTYLFVFIAGFLFYYLKDKFKYYKFLKKKFLYVVCPTIFILIPGFISFLVSNGGYHSLESHSFKYKTAFAVVWPFIINPPVWYVGMIVIIFVLSPFLLALIKRMDLFIFVLLLTYFLGIMYHREWPVIDFVNTRKINILLTYFLFYFRMALHFLPFYLLGMLVCKFWEKEQYNFFKKVNLTRITFFCWIFLGFIGIFILKPFSSWNTFLYLSKSCMVIWLYGALKNNCDKLGKKLKICLKFLAEYSFSIFFLHFIIRNLLLKKCLFNGSVPDGYIIFTPPCNQYEFFIDRIVLFFCMITLSIIIAWGGREILKLLGIKKTRIFIGV